MAGRRGWISVRHDTITTSTASASRISAAAGAVWPTSGRLSPSAAPTPAADTARPGLSHLWDIACALVPRRPIAAAASSTRPRGHLQRPVLQWGPPGAIPLWCAASAPVRRAAHVMPTAAPLSWRSATASAASSRRDAAASTTAAAAAAAARGALSRPASRGAGPACPYGRSRHGATHSKCAHRQPQQLDLGPASGAASATHARTADAPLR